MRKGLAASILLIVPMILVGQANWDGEKKADSAVAAQKAAIDAKLLSEIHDRSQLMSNLKYLSDVIGPRLTGSKGLERANKWTAEKMKEYGLTEVKLEPWEIPIGWERHSASMTLISPRRKPLTIASAGWSPGTSGKVTTEVVYIDAKTKADLEKYKGKLKGKVIMRSPPSFVAGVVAADQRYGTPGANRRPEAAGKETPTQRDGKAAPPKAEEKKESPKGDEKKAATPPPARPTRESLREQFALQQEMGEFLKNEGAIATLRDSAKPHGLLVTTGGWRTGDRGSQTSGLVSLFMAHEDYALLYRLITDHKETPKVELEVSNQFSEGPVTVYNTVGEVRGSEKPEEFVVVGAHLDSWDLATGTTDNGTGSCVVLEAARAVAALAKAGYPPKRTIRFVLFSGEEQGLHGSKQYVARHKDEMPKTSMAIVHDTGTGKVTGFGLLGREAVRKVMAPELESLKAIGFEGLTLGGITGGTDHWSFDQAGIPGFACNQENDEYRFTHHTQSDTFDKAKEPNLIQGAQVMAITAMRVANLSDLLPRTDKRESFGGRGRQEEKKTEKKEEKK